MAEVKAPRRKVPMAVNIIVLIGLTALLAWALLGGYLLFNLWAAGALVLEGFTWATEGDLTAEASSLLTGTYYLLAALGMALILFGVLRLRRWAWAALMFWCGLNLAVSLLRYAEHGGNPRLYFALLTSAALVLLLNLEIVQSTFGLGWSAAEAPLRWPTPEAPDDDPTAA